VHTINTDTNLI